MALSDIADQLDKADPTLARYNRQMLWPQIGIEGQKKLRSSKVLLVGCGALGTVLGNLLARAGVGHLTIVDRDFIEITNLQRQVLFDHDDIDQNLPKSVAAQKKIARINPDITVEAVVQDVNHTNIEQLALGGGGMDLLLDGTDNFETRFLINDVSAKHNIPWIYGAVISASGLAMNILPGKTPCLRCIFETMPPPGMNPTCDTAGVLGPAVSVVSSWQALEAMKLLTGNTADLSPFLFSFDLWDNRFQQLKIAKARELADCPVCKHQNYEFLSGKFTSATTSLCGRNAVQISLGAATKINFEAIAANLRNVGKASFNKFMLKCPIVEGEGERRKEYELTLFADGRAIVKGTNEASVARAIYSKYVGA